MLGKNCARALPTLAVADASCASCAADVGPLRQQFGRQARRHARRWRSAFSAAAADAHGFRRPRHQRRQRVDVLLQRLPQRRHRARWLASTLSCCATSRSVAGAGTQPLLDRVEDARGAGDVALRDAQAVLRGQHLEIGVGDAGQRGQRHHVAIEAAGDRGLFRGQRGVAVLAPEIDFVAGAERGRIVDDLAAAIGEAARARAGGARIASPNRRRSGSATAARR